MEYLEDEIVFVSHKTVPVYAYGRGAKEALLAFSEAFDLQWRSLVDAPESSLTAGGVKRRRAMQAVVASVLDKGRWIRMPSLTTVPANLTASTPSSRAPVARVEGSRSRGS